MFPASPSLLQLTLARSREPALNYLTLSHIGLLASGKKNLSGHSSIFSVCFQMDPLQPECVSVLLDLTEVTPQHCDILYKSPQVPALVGRSAELQRQWESLVGCSAAVPQGSPASEWVERCYLTPLLSSASFSTGSITFKNSVPASNF